MNSSKINFGVLWCLLLVTSCSGKWRWPDGETSASVRIDTKVRFTDTDDDKQSQTKVHRVQADEVPFQEPDETEGFYNRPPGAGRYPVRVESHRAPYRVDGHGIFQVNNQQHQNAISDGTLDSLQFCKCVSKPDCNPQPNSAGACGLGKFLCCYQRPNRGDGESFNNEYFNEVDGQRPLLQPNREHFGTGFNNPGVLVGPDGPTGQIGPHNQQKQPAVLIGPEGPTGIIGPAQHGDAERSPSAQNGVYFGGLGSYGQRPVLVGPGGPTGIIGPNRGGRPVLVGPGGPTGIIGPNRGGRPVLVGPGGPTGIIGPAYGRQPGVLVGPGGPTGSIGPGRQLLVGPGGPTGLIGPQGFYGK